MLYFYSENAETNRLREDFTREKYWKRWGPYLSERQWGTVREDYSPDGACWDYLTFNDSRSRAYRWGEDGLLGFTDRKCRLCFSLALWNEKDPILKERLFGLSGSQGNHGEDVKEVYYYLESLPTHSYCKALYKYSHHRYPYELLLEENQRRGRGAPEFELVETGIFDKSEYFDVFVEYAKASPDDIFIVITIANRGDVAAPLHILPTLWFRNTWSWGRAGEDHRGKPNIESTDPLTLRAFHQDLGAFFLTAEKTAGTPKQLFTENETNFERLYGTKNPRPFTKDSFHDHVINGVTEVVNPALNGTKAAFWYTLTCPPKSTQVIRLRLTAEAERVTDDFGAVCDQTLATRIKETNEYYIIEQLNDEQFSLVRQVSAGLLWCKQFYYYSVKDWAEGDPAQPTPAPTRKNVRNSEWRHLYNRDIISMPDSWEYPWYAAWDLAFHATVFSRVDPIFAKEQLLLLLREWYMHPNGQIPAYEFSFSDVNPPVHAWAVWRVYKMTAPPGKRDRKFLVRAFHKLLLNFTWWVNQTDIHGKNLFTGGFLGLDNIGVFDRGAPAALGGHLEQADATAWMAFYCGTMLSIALELSRDDVSYEDVASKFFEHFVAITDAMNMIGGAGLWDDQDGFYYDRLHVEDKIIPLRVRSLVGIIPIVAVEVIEDQSIAHLSGFRKRLSWFLENRKDLARHVTYMVHSGAKGEGRSLLAVPSKERLLKILKPLLDESEFLSPHGVRSVSKFHEQSPYALTIKNQEFRIGYEPGESITQMFGGNSNWRGPVWFPLNFLIIEALERYDYFYGNDFKIECPTGSGHFMTLREVSIELCRRLVRLFQIGNNGARPYAGVFEKFAADPHWKDLHLFFEYFHGDTGQGLGACHQTGWTALVALCLEKIKRAENKKR